MKANLIRFTGGSIAKDVSLFNLKTFNVIEPSHFKSDTESVLPYFPSLYSARLTLLISDLGFLNQFLLIKLVYTLLFHTTLAFFWNQNEGGKTNYTHTSILT